MGTLPNMADVRSLITDVKLTPFAQVLVTLTKQEHTQLIWDARYWKTAHQRSLTRIQEIEAGHQQEIEQYALREAALRSELNTARAKIRDLQKRVFGRKSEHSSQANNQAQKADVKSSRSRGQQQDAPGHGRTMQACPCRRTLKPSRLSHRGARAVAWASPTSRAPKTVKCLRSMLKRIGA